MLTLLALNKNSAHQVLKDPLLAIEKVVVGDLSEAGCFVDWAALSMVLEKHVQEQ